MPFLIDAKREYPVFLQLYYSSPIVVYLPAFLGIAVSPYFLWPGYSSVGDMWMVPLDGLVFKGCNSLVGAAMRLS